MKAVSSILRHERWLLAAVFALALFLRLFSLSSIPPGLHGDEASIGYNAYSLLKTARDQDGNFLPLAFDQFGNFRAAGYHYLDVPFVALLGLNTLAVRLPAALFGSFTIIIFYLFLAEFFGNKSTALIGSFLLAILPWHIDISRASSEAIISSFFVLLGIHFLYKGIKRKTFPFALFSLGFLSLLISFFFYHAAGFFVPAFLPFFFLLSFFIYKPSKAKIIGAIVVFIALVLGLMLFLSIGGGNGRISQVSLLNIPGGTAELKHSMDEDGIQNPLFTRFYHNKLYFYGRLFLTFYSEHLSGDFLFVNNGYPIRYRMPWTGNLYLIEAPFLLLGFAILLSESIKSKKYLYLIPVVWLLIGPIPAALTWEDLPNVIRSSLMIPALTMIVAFGFYEFLKITKGHIRTLLVIVIMLILFQNVAYFFHNYFYHSKIHEPWYRSAAEEDLVFTLAGLSKKYKEIIMTTERNNNLIFHLFYLKFDPATFQKLGSPREKDHLKFQNMIFRYGSCPIADADLQNINLYKDTLFVVKTDDCKIPKQGEIIKTIRTPDGMPAFYLVHLHAIE